MSCQKSVSQHVPDMDAICAVLEETRMGLVMANAKNIYIYIYVTQNEKPRPENLSNYYTHFKASMKIVPTYVFCSARIILMEAFCCYLL